MLIDKDFEKFLLNLNKENDSEIFSFNYKSKKYWLKKARATKSHFIHKLFYKIFPIEVLLPVEAKSAKEALFFEVNKIETFKSLGIGTPTVVFKNEDFFVLEDCSKSVNSNIRKRDITKEKMYYFIDKLLLEISKIHNQNQFHGGAQARNFLYKDGVIVTIDLEDSFDKNVDLKILQFRDLILFLISLTKTRSSFELDYEYIINRYISLVPDNSDFKERLKALSLRMSFLIKISQIGFINNLIGRDGKGFFKLFMILKNLEIE